MRRTAAQLTYWIRGKTAKLVEMLEGRPELWNTTITGWNKKTSCYHKKYQTEEHFFSIANLGISAL